jgi:ribosome maturation factor RimP
VGIAHAFVLSGPATNTSEGRLMSVVDRVRELVAPMLRDLEVTLYDIEFTGGSLRLLIDRDGGVGLDTITTVSRLVSRELDASDAVPGSYTLEVSSPGLERPLRTPEHFRAVVGDEITVKCVALRGGSRRVAGVLTSSDDDGITVADADGVPHRVAYDDIAKARTVFAWATEGSAGAGRGPTTKKARTR